MCPKNCLEFRGGGQAYEKIILSLYCKIIHPYVEGMVDGLNDHRIADIGEFFSEGFRWMGNAGCGTKNNLKEFQDNWQKPFQVLFVLSL